MADHQHEVDQLEWVCFASTLVHSSMLTRSLSASKNLAMTKMIDNTIFLTTIVFIDGPSHPFPLLQEPNQKQTQRRPLRQEGGKVNEENWNWTRPTPTKMLIHPVLPMMLRNRKQTWTLPRLTLSEVTNGNVSPSPSKTTKIYASLLQGAKIPMRRT